MTDEPRSIGEIAKEIVNDILRQRKAREQQEHQNVVPFRPRRRAAGGDYPDEAA